MISVPLRDGCFNHAHSAGLGGGAIYEAPDTMSWQRCNAAGDIPTNAPTVVYTDVCLSDVENTTDKRQNIAWLVEPPGCGRTHYATAARLERRFDKILTFNNELLATNSPLEIQDRKFMFYPLGGTWIAKEDWALYVKSKNVSIIASDKDVTEGHKLRHASIRMYPQLDVFGRGYRPVQSKLEALAEYRYSVVIEAWRGDYYFSEKLIDCFATGTIPIYWGCPSIGKFFDMRGIITFLSAEGLRYALENVSEADYLARQDAIKRNFELARQYRCPEDWITKHYPNLFTGVQR